MQVDDDEPHSRENLNELAKEPGIRVKFSYRINLLAAYFFVRSHVTDPGLITSGVARLVPKPSSSSS